MRLTDLSLGQAMIISVHVGEQQLEFESELELINAKKHIVYLAPIMKDNKLLTFTAKGILTDIIVNLPDSKPYVFRNMILNAMKKEDGTFCYGVLDNAEGMALNRRGAFRCSIDCNAILRIGTMHKTYEIIIRDVSVTGFSFTFNGAEEGSCDEGQTVHCVLNDFLEETYDKFSFQLYGMIVRKVELENKRVIFGCQLTSPVKGLDSYIAKKERLRLHQQRDSS